MLLTTYIVLTQRHVFLFLSIVHSFQSLSCCRGHWTYTAGTVNSVPLLRMARNSVDFPGHFWWHAVIKLIPKVYKLNSELYIFYCTGRQKCTKLQRFAPIFSKKFPGVTSLDPIPGMRQAPSPDPSPSSRVHRPTFCRASAAAVLLCNWRWWAARLFVSKMHRQTLSAVFFPFDWES